MIVKKQILIKPYGLKRTLHIYLPLDYRKTTKRYPVLYMYDGHNLFFDDEATYGKSWGLKDYLDQHKVDLIVVGVECNHEGNQRLVEYSPYDFNDRYWGKVEGTGKVYMEWLVKDLKPYIDAHYRTYPDRKHTGIAGSSMGGLMSLYSISQWNKTFSKAACLSSYIDLVMKNLMKDLEVKLKDPTLVYLSWGGKESRKLNDLALATQNNLIVGNKLTEKGAQVYYLSKAKGMHNEASWEKEVPLFLKYLYNVD